MACDDYGSCIGCGAGCRIERYYYCCKVHVCEACAKPYPCEPVFGPPRSHQKDYHLSAAGRAALAKDPAT